MLKDNVLVNGVEMMAWLSFASGTFCHLLLYEMSMNIGLAVLRVYYYGATYTTIVISNTQISVNHLRCLPPRAVLYAGSDQPVEIQGLSPSDTRFKILDFIGDVYTSAASERVKRFAEQNTSSFAIRDHRDKEFDFLCILMGRKRRPSISTFRLF
ncbi:uncharacterized protein STEHIDRAFT_163246 [Stereum hirsutum FP-91666 SS1]|uniref:Phenol hydroxylase-like C-terminal dimerisation domain-containing protein n=1 Tax=Stereum hirsutum (strain FP-91666) TaxID=721885 RepID=R7S093_STEHR|nr:uncharacterized protein STEHIDRAFT_163246 [Stereum hirsutum FP-91666 SS1]EIM79992.1 hypothetical protein STEHIDRAFT_163246 [Stereum hirsutum FP-91666 SS1]